MATGFEALGERTVGYDEVDALRHADAARLRARCAACLGALAVLALLSLNVLTFITSSVHPNDTFLGVVSDPATTLLLLQQKLHGLAPFAVPAVDAQAHAQALLDTAQRFDYSANGDAAGALGYLSMRVGERVSCVLVTAVCGVLLGLSGMLFQNVFRNPIATPSMLGVQSGVSVGALVLVALYGAAAPQMVLERYVLCYGCGIALLALTIAGGAFISGKRPFQVVDLLLVGTAVGAVVGVVVQYLPASWDDAMWQVYYAVSESIVTDTSPEAYAAVAVVSALAVVPCYLLRWQLNALSFSDAEVRMLGIDPSRLRVFALVAGSLMALVAAVTVGLVGLAALVVPLLARYLFGSEAREQFWGCVCLGPLVLLACRDLVDLAQIAWSVLGASLSLGTVVSVLMLPVLVWIVRSGRRGWE